MPEGLRGLRVLPVSGRLQSVWGWRSLCASPPSTHARRSQHTLAQYGYCSFDYLFSVVLAILANFAVQPLMMPACDGDPNATDVGPPWDWAPISEAVGCMPLPILGIHRCQSRISDDQEVLTI